MEWDESISDEFKSESDDILWYLGNVRAIDIPRTFLNYDERDPPQRVELHGFSNASKQYYGACNILKSIFKGGKISVLLIASKSRLAPIKETTIPRLKLIGILI